MTTRIQFKSYTPRWSDLAEGNKEVWAPTTETFLATLIGCAKEQAETARAGAATTSAGSRIDIHVGDDSDGIASPAVDGRELTEETLPPHAAARSAQSPIRWRFTFMQPAIIPSDTAEPASFFAKPAAAAVTEAPVKQDSGRQQPIQCRWTFMQPAIIPTEERVPVARRPEEPPAAIGSALIEAAETEKPAFEILPPAKPAMCRSRFVRPVIVAATNESATVIAPENAPVMKVDAVAAAPAIEKTPAIMEPVAVPLPELRILEAFDEEPAAASIGATAPVAAPEHGASPAEDTPVQATAEIPVTASIPPTVPVAALENLVSATENAPAQPAAEMPAAATPEVKAPVRSSSHWLLRAWTWFNAKRALGATKQLRVAETVSLGDKRFVAVIHVDGRKFLIGGGASSVALLTQLDPAQDLAGLPAGSSAAEGRA